MPYVNVVSALSYVGEDGNSIEMGETGAAQRIQVDGLPHDLSADLAPAASKTIFDATVDIADFDCLFLVSDIDTVDVELTCDQNAGVGKMVFVISLRAGFWQPLFTNRSFAGYLEGFAGGTADVIDRIKIKNNHATATARVRCLAFT